MKIACAALPAVSDSLPLPLEVPRVAWPALIEHAAEAIAGRAVFDSVSLAQELRAIAAALRVEVAA